MLSFKNFLTESVNYDKDEDAEYEDLSRSYSNHMYGDGDIPDELDDVVLRHHHIKHLNESEDDPTAPKLSFKERVAKNKAMKQAEIANKKAKVDSWVRGEVKKSLRRHKEVYGEETGAPVRPEDAPEIGRKAVEDHYSKSPQEREEELKGAAKRIGYVAYGSKSIHPSKLAERLGGGNKKTDTVVNNPLVKYNGKITSHVSSYGGAAGSYVHYHSGDDNDDAHTTINQCENATAGCRTGMTIDDVKKNGTKEAIKTGPACLAQTGAFQFAGTRRKIQINSHIRSNPKTIRDHAILMAHHLENKAKDAEKSDTMHSVRGQTTDERGKDISAVVDETARHSPLVKKRTLLFGYSKNPKEVLDAARKTKKIRSGDTTEKGVPEHIVHSHPGPAVYKDNDGKMQLNFSTIRRLVKLRKAHETSKNEGLVANDYVVTGGRSLDEKGDAIPDTVHTQLRTPGKNASKEDKEKFEQNKRNFERVHNSIKRVRFWDLHHSGELKAGESESHHDHKTGTGYTTVEQDGKRLKVGYHDRKANIGETPSGHVPYEDSHDGRYADGENKESHSQVTAPVSSGSGLVKRGSYRGSLHHQMDVHYDMHGNKLRHSLPGTLHEAHPDLMKKAGYTYDDKDTTFDESKPKRKSFTFKKED